MFTKISQVGRCLLLSFSLIFIGCTDENTQITQPEIELKSTAKQGVCYFSNAYCQLSVAGLNLSARLSRSPLPEEPIDVSIFYPESVAIDSIWLEGVNMYMGKIPVVIDNTITQDAQKVSSGWFMFGACHQPKMEWEIVIKIKGRQEPARMRFVVEQ